jgi:hypothetical protein
VKLVLKKGITSQRLAVFIQNSSSTTGAGLTGLVFNSAGLTWYYWREDEGNAGGTSVTLATATRGTFASGGFIEKDATNLPGFYEIGVPDAALATGADWVVMLLKGATNMAPLPLEIELVNYDPADGVRLGLTALPNAAAEAAGGLYTRGSGAGQIAQDANGRIDSRTAAMAADVVTASAVATDAIGAAELAADAATEIRDAIFGGTMTEAYAADGAAATLAQMLYMIWGAVAEFAISGTTLTVKKLDGTTTAMTFTLDSATDPTSRTRAS